MRRPGEHDIYRPMLRNVNYAMILIVASWTALIAFSPEFRADRGWLISVGLLAVSLGSFWNITGGLWFSGKRLGFPHNILVRAGFQRFILGFIVAVPIAIALGTYTLQDAMLAFAIFVFVTTLSAGSLPFFKLAWDEAAEIMRKEKRFFGVERPVEIRGPYGWESQLDDRRFVINRFGRGLRVCDTCLTLVGMDDFTCWRCHKPLPGPQPTRIR